MLSKAKLISWDGPFKSFVGWLRYYDELSNPFSDLEPGEVLPLVCRRFGRARLSGFSALASLPLRSGQKDKMKLWRWFKGVLARDMNVFIFYDAQIKC